MFTLKLRDNTEIQFSDNSNIASLVGVYSNYGEVDLVRPHITNENLIGATLTNEETGEIIEMHDIVTNGIYASSDYQGEVVVRFNLRQKTEVEILKEKIAIIQAEQETQNEAIDFLAME